MNTASNPIYSLIIPTFKRADEVQECLESLTKQTFRNFEVIIADGTPGTSLESVTIPFQSLLDINFQYEEFIGVSEARNLGFLQAKGEYIIFLDSDCIIPEGYMQAVHSFVLANHPDLFGGPDAAAGDFSPVQKAISYSMTSMLTTGGIRGKKQHVGAYHPRSFNMGMKKSVFEAVGGYSDFKCGEDIELSIRIIKKGFKVSLIEDAYVYHKRRTDFKQFFRQVFRFGAARINIGVRHPGEIKPAHLFPLVFCLGFLFSCVLTLFLPSLGWVFLAFYKLYFIALFFDSLLLNKQFKVAVLSVLATVVQFSAYAWGFLKNGFAVYVQGKPKGIEL